MNPQEHGLDTQKHPPVSAAPASVSLSQPSGQAGGTPGLAGDTDLIEDEWVEIVKRIIAENRDDPYNLTKAITLLRADYMKKRYGKDINVTD